jgi:Tfp pilus assembly protein FimV
VVARVVASSRSQVASTAYVAASTAVAQKAETAAPAAVVARRGTPARPGDRVHVVFEGESLWSVAEDVLGPGATVTEVARAVNRLWAHNRERIGTGDRDLLPIGTRLELR